MSGLVHFFRHCLPESAPASPDGGGDGDTYRTSLVPRQRLDRAVVPVRVPPTDGDTAETAPAAHNQEPRHALELDGSGWAETRDGFLRQYMLARLLGMASVRDDDDTDNAVSPADSEEPDASQFETQPPLLPEHETVRASEPPHQHGQDCSRLTPAKKKPRISLIDAESTPCRMKRNLIPHHTKDTLDSTKYFSDVSLYTRRIDSIGLCRVIKYWRVRGTRRSAPPGRYAWYDSSRLPRLAPPPGSAEDGPLAGAYGRVLVLDVAQLDRPSPVRRLAERAHLPSSAPLTGAAGNLGGLRLVRIFLYNRYADAMEEILRKKGTKKVLYLSLRQVPALCILPWSYADWAERAGWHSFCLCIGDQCTKSVTGGHDTMKKQHFDHEELRVAAGWADEDKAFKEYQIGRVRSDEKLTAIQVCNEAEGRLRTEYLRFRRDKSDISSVASTNSGITAATESLLEPSPQILATTNGLSLSPCRTDIGEQLTDTVEGKTQNLRLGDLGRLLLSDYPSRDKDEDSRVEVDCVVDVSAAVMAFGSTSMTQKGDYKISLDLIDDSLPLDDPIDGASPRIRSVKCNIFCKKLDDLPKLRRAGDVLRLHHVAAQFYCGEVQLRGLPESSYTVYPETADKQGRVAELQKWAQKRLLEYPSIRTEYRFTIDQVRRHGDNTRENMNNKYGWGDMTVMVVGMAAYPQQLNGTYRGITPYGFLRVWDGTGFPECDPLPPALADQANQSREPSNAMLDKIESVIESYRAITSDHTLTAAESTTGRVLNVAIWEKACWFLVLEAVSLGSFIRLRNIRDSFSHDSSLPCVNVNSNSYLTPLPDLTYEVIYMLKKHNHRLQRGEKYNPRSGVLQFKPRGLQILLAGPSDAEYHGRFRIVDTVPTLNQLRQFGLEQLFSGGEPDEYAHRFCIEIQDEFATCLVAMLTDDVGLQLLSSSATQIMAECAGHPQALSARVGDKADLIETLRRLIEDDKFWEGTLCCVEVNGSRFFILTNIS